VLLKDSVDVGVGTVLEVVESAQSEPSEVKRLGARGADGVGWCLCGGHGVLWWCS
jgi:hypothetical protein